MNRDEKKILAYLAEENSSAALAHAKTLALPLAFLVDAINEKATELLADIVLEEDASGYHIIEDYREDIKQWLMK